MCNFDGAKLAIQHDKYGQINVKSHYQCLPSRILPINLLAQTMRNHFPTILKPIDRSILGIALPSVVSNITVPLLGLVDVAISGHLGSTEYLAAIAVGAMIFNVIYWVFGFLRMGTSGMTSQAFGRNDMAEVVRLLLRSLVVGLAVALAVLVFQQPLLRLALAVIGPDSSVVPIVECYFGYCVWGAPAMLCLYGLTGWFIGMQNTRIPMMISIMQNIVNIAVSISLVAWCGMKIEGVALGTVIAQYAGLAMALLMIGLRYGGLRKHFKLKGLFVREAMMRFFAVNRDIFLRTLFLVAVNLYFVSSGASQGSTILAVNTLLMQFFTLFSYVMDCFAYAGEALCGKHWGAADKQMFSSTVSRLFRWGIVLATVYTAVYFFGGEPFLGLLTDDANVIVASRPFFLWAVAVPFAGMAAFIWDGVFIGITATRGMLVSSVIAAIAFFSVELLMIPTMGNHALWLALIVYLATRGIVQTFLFKRISFNG